MTISFSSDHYRIHFSDLSAFIPTITFALLLLYNYTAEFETLWHPIMMIISKNGQYNTIQYNNL